jgi:hypothetical protein
MVMDYSNTMIIKNMENKFAVHYQTWKNEKATEFTIQKFREFFPNNKMRVVSDNGLDYSHFVEKYNIDFTFSDINVFPGGRFKTIDGCYEWLKRVNDTCLKYETDWIVIFEDDVLTKNSNIEFPNEDSGGLIAWPWKAEMIDLLKSKNTKNTLWGYGMCGGSIFRRESFLEAYSKINEFNLEELSTYDNRIVGWGDTLINCFIQYFGYSYQLWDGMDDMTYPGRIVSKKACFVHGYKELY